MNILYIVKTFSVIEPCGVIQLSAVTKSHGHKSFVCSIDDDDIAASINENNIDVVAYSFMTTEAGAFCELTKDLRKIFPDIIIIAGGPHPTYYPQLIDSWDINAIVKGEGDHVINELIENLAAGKDISHLNNVHTKEFKNPQGDLIEDLDVLPYSDRELLKDIEPFKHVRIKTFFPTRGCPFACSYCFISAFNSMHRGLGKIHRRRTVENLILEIEEVVKNYPTDFIRFGDDAMILKEDEWIHEFAEKYPARVGLPFYFLINPNCVTPSLVKLLKKAGCHSVMMGIESGNERLRKTILHRRVSDESMLNSFKMFREAGIRVFSNTILGLPDSDLETDLQSLEFSLKCRPSYLGLTVFTPFPGTKLYDYSKDTGYLQHEIPFIDSFPVSMQQSSVLNHITDKQKNFHRNVLVLAPIANHWPIFKNLIVNHLVYWKHNKLFDLCGFAMRNYLNMRIFPFKKSLYSFFIIVKRVFSIDKKNYSVKPQKTAFKERILKATSSV